MRSFGWVEVKVMWQVIYNLTDSKISSVIYGLILVEMFTIESS